MTTAAELEAEGMPAAAIARSLPAAGHAGDGWCASCTKCVAADEPCGGTHGFCPRCDVLVVNGREHPIPVPTIPLPHVHVGHLP